MPISQEQFAQITGDIPGMGNDPQALRMRVEALENCWNVPFIFRVRKFRLG